LIKMINSDDYDIDFISTSFANNTALDVVVPHSLELVKELLKKKPKTINNSLYIAC